jgi:hypothetical protein
MQLLRNIEGDGPFSWSQTIDVSLVHIRNSNGSLLIIWYLLYESMSGYRLVKDSLLRNSLMKSVTDFRGDGIEFFRRQGDMGCLHRLVVDIDDCAWVLDRGDKVVCQLFVFAGFGGGGSKVALMGGLVSRNPLRSV